ncbi:hypothetical protein R6L23_01435 [Streptomyces sp. SR27]|uniref:hypothetical protein n=1 Tax=Streptomyces sp. SR27 TaxID=3076630 RepID=UPI00295BE549|nr:hypothetical protein [Streptomyces sp. SR27]MDV9186898.1 hypothetical protein [Streptomyces sp. SR27]
MPEDRATGGGVLLWHVDQDAAADVAGQLRVGLVGGGLLRHTLGGGLRGRGEGVVLQGQRAAPLDEQSAADEPADGRGGLRCAEPRGGEDLRGGRRAEGGC